MLILMNSECKLGSKPPITKFTRKSFMKAEMVLDLEQTISKKIPTIETGAFGFFRLKQGKGHN